MCMCGWDKHKVSLLCEMWMRYIHRQHFVDKVALAHGIAIFRFKANHDNGSKQLQSAFLNFVSFVSINERGFFLISHVSRYFIFCVSNIRFFCYLNASSRKCAFVSQNHYIANLDIFSLKTVGNSINTLNSEYEPHFHNNWHIPFTKHPRTLQPLFRWNKKKHIN